MKVHQKDTRCLEERPFGEDLTLRVLQGRDAQPYCEKIASLRITMFKEYPYLYEGILEEETEYLEMYFRSFESLLFLVFDQEALVAFASALPLDQSIQELNTPLLEQKIHPRDCLYIGELMITSPYRGRGILRYFLDSYEKFAIRKGYSHLIFMTIKRTLSHKMCPENYRNPDPIWQHFGYERLPHKPLILTWKQIDTRQQEKNELDLWGKNIKERLL